MTQAPAPWIQRTERAGSLWALGTALTLTAVALDQTLSGRLTLFFDVCFISICALMATKSTPGQFYATAVMPPALLGGVLMFLAIVSPETVADPQDGVVQALVSGLAHHAGAFATGFILTLAVLQWRTATSTRR